MQELLILGCYVLATFLLTFDDRINNVASAFLYIVGTVYYLLQYIQCK